MSQEEEIMAANIEETDTMSTEGSNVCGMCDRKASMHCTNCPEYLCRDCSVLHTTQKFAKDHEVIEITVMKQHGSQQTEVCEPCSEMGKSSEAKMFCTKCDEKLCGNCTEIHKSQKMTKLHALIPITEYQISDQAVFCEPCHERSVQQNAAVYCSICEEDLCSSCGNRHKIQKATRSHELVDTAMKQLTRSKTSTDVNVRCEPCNENGMVKEATNACKDCNERICIECSASHRKQKATRNHTLFDIALIPVSFCDPCYECGEEIKAVCECHSCNECLCDSCTNSHTRQKATKHHQLNAVSLPDFQECDPCTEEGTAAFAIRYCKECKEYVCIDCSKIHRRQKITRNHTLIKAIDAKYKEKAGVDEADDQMKENHNNAECIHMPEEKKSQDNIRPGKPVADEILSDSVTLQWEKPNSLQSKAASYQLRYRERNIRRWTFHSAQPEIGYAVISGLKTQCTYTFQVRVIDDDIEGPYSPESDDVTTKSSLASRLLPYTTKVRDGLPAIHKLNSTENRAARDQQAKTRKFDLGKPPLLNDNEKTILLVGATGTGKSTLVDGIINYVTGVNWKDPFRFTLIDLEKDEENKNQAISQTEWVTCYSINPEEGSRLDYRLNIIDTPGFGDTRGLDRDNEIVNQLRNLFYSKGAKGVVFIDAVCFLIKAPDARLTAVQKYIFMSILSLFGQDIEENICTLITFADGDKPPVLEALHEAKLPVQAWYPFNNSGLFANNTDDEMTSLAPMFWEMGNKSFKRFFDSLKKMSTKSLQQTKQVLVERERLETTICQLQPQVDAGLSKVHELKQEICILTQNEKKILDNQDFEYEVEETQSVKIDLAPGRYVTNCITCNRTCHDDCKIPNDSDKARCAAMGSDGYCGVCPGECFWNEHCNNPYKFTFVNRTIKKTYKEKLAMYQGAQKQKLTHVQVIEKMEDDLEALGEKISKMMKTINKSNNTLKQIALHPHPLSMVEHIDLMIESEKMEKKQGFKERITVLQAYKKRAEIHKDVDIFQQEYKAASSKVTGKKPKGFFAKLFGL